MCHISAVTGFEIEHKFDDGNNVSKPSFTPGYSRPHPVTVNPSLNNQSLQNTSHHIRFNIYDQSSSDTEVDGSNFEQLNTLPEVIVLTSDDDEPPKPKRAKPDPTIPFPTTDTSRYSDVADLADFNQSASVVTAPSDRQSFDLNDSLKEFEAIQTPFSSDCPITSEIQKTAPYDSEDYTSVDQDPRILTSGQPVHDVYSQTPSQYHSHSSIHSDMNIASVRGDKQYREGVSRQMCGKTESMFNKSMIHSSFFNTPSSSAVNLFMSSIWGDKEPTQDQIQESLMKAISRIDSKPGSCDPSPPTDNHITNTARIAQECFNGAAPRGFLAGSVVRRTPPISGDVDAPVGPTVKRTPLKSLSLGHEDNKTIRLQSDDRSIPAGGHIRGPNKNNKGHASNVLSATSNQPQRPTMSVSNRGDIYSSSMISQKPYNPFKGSFPNRCSADERELSSISRFADLKAFHQLQHQPSGGRLSIPLSMTGGFNSTTGISEDHWLRRVKMIDPTVGSKV